MAFSACVQSCLMSVVIKTTGVILPVVPRRLTLPPHATAFCPVFTRARETGSRFILNNVSSSVGLVMRPAGPEKSTGIISAAFVKDPTDPQWQDGNTWQLFGEVISGSGS